MDGNSAGAAAAAASGAGRKRKVMCRVGTLGHKLDQTICSEWSRGILTHESVDIVGLHDILAL